MIDRDFFAEVWGTIVKQRWRSLMTAFGVFWGLLMLVLLIGAGTGLRNGMYASFQVLPSNSVIAVSNPTLLSYAGFEAGRSWSFTMSDMERLRKIMAADIEYIAMLNIANEGTPIPVKYGNIVSNFVLAGEQPQACEGFPQKMLEGRFIDELDMIENRNVCVIGDVVTEKLFGSESPLGKEMQVDGKSYVIVGVSKKSTNNVDVGFNMSEGIVIPLNLMQASYNQGEDVQVCNIVLRDEVDADEAIAVIDPLIREWHNLHPDDSSALRFRSLKKGMRQVKSLFEGVNLLIWIVGLGTLIAGLVGVTNIMMITVKERTKEIGIRTAMGAKPLSVVGQIMCESMFLATFSGLAGLCLGVWLLAILNNLIGDGMGTFSHPYMPIWTGVISLLIIILGGLLAGVIPAIRALKIELVKALSDE